MNYLQSTSNLHMDIINDHRERIESLEEEINSVTESLIYIDENLCSIRDRLEKLERFVGIIGKGVDEKHTRELEQLLVEIDLEQ
jgi:archaellum component FlaC